MLFSIYHSAARHRPPHRHRHHQLCSQAFQGSDHQLLQHDYFSGALFGAWAATRRMYFGKGGQQQQPGHGHGHGHGHGVPQMERTGSQSQAVPPSRGTGAAADGDRGDGGGGDES